MRWFGPARARGYCLVALVFVTPLAIAVYQAAARSGVDFVAFWAAAKLAWTNPAASYDFEALKTVQRAAGLAICPFVNPPPYLMAIAPLGRLPYAAALLAFILGTFAIFLISIWKTAPLAPSLTCGAGLLNVCFGQNGLLTGGVFIGAARLLDSRPFVAGILFGVLVIKPQLAVLVPVALAFGGCWRAFAGAATSAIFLVLISWVVLGSETYLAFFKAFAHQPTYLFNATLQRMMVSPFATTLAVGAPNSVAALVQGACTLGAAGVVAAVWRGDQPTPAKAAVLAAATPFASPYLYPYDLVILFLPILWLAKKGAAEPLPWERLVIGLAFVAPIVASTLVPHLHWADPSLIVNALLLGAVLRRVVTAPDGPADSCSIQSA